MGICIGLIFEKSKLILFSKIKMYILFSLIIKVLVVYVEMYLFVCMIVSSRIGYCLLKYKIIVI